MAPPRRDPVAAFLEYLAAERRASPHTLRAYRADLAEFGAFLRRAGLSGPGEVDARTVRAYLASLHQRGLARTSIAAEARGGAELSPVPRAGAG